MWSKGSGTTPDAEAVRVLAKVLENEALPKSEEFLAALTLARLELDANHLEDAARWIARADGAHVLGRGGLTIAGACARSSVLATLWARLLIEAGAPADRLRAVLGELRAEYRAFVDQLSTMPARAGGVGFLYYDTRRSLLAELIRLHLHLEGPEAGSTLALEDLLLAQNLGSLARALRVEPPELSEIHTRLLAPDRGILV